MSFLSAPFLLKLQYIGHLMGRGSLEKTLMLGKIERRRRGWQRTRWLDSVINSMDMSLSKFWEMVKDREAWRAAVCGLTKSQTQLSSWTKQPFLCLFLGYQCLVFGFLLLLFVFMHHSLPKPKSLLGIENPKWPLTYRHHGWWCHVPLLSTVLISFAQNRPRTSEQRNWISCWHS